MNFHNLVDIAGLYKGNAAAIELKVVIKTVSSRDAAVDHGRIPIFPVMSDGPVT